MTINLQRHPANPIMLPDLNSAWECYNVFNPSVIYKDGRFHMHYRAQGLDWISRIGYADSLDGIHFQRMSNPVLQPLDKTDARGVEDPRVTEIDGVYYMTYTAYGFDPEREQKPDWSKYWGGEILPMIASSRDLIHWERVGPIVVGEDNKDHVLFPRRIKGKYAALHRRRPQVCLAYSDDLRIWRNEEMMPIYGPRPDGEWDRVTVGSNGVPIETEYGWLLINHGYSEEHIYHLGVVLVELEDPSEVINRPKEPIFWPEEIWELRGDVPNVVFSCANPVVDETVYIYYGGADHVIGLATCRLLELIEFARFG